MRSGSSMVVLTGPRFLRGLGDIVSLDSNKQAYAEVDLGKTILDAVVKKQKSHAACTKNSTYGWVGSKLHVDKGCRADFDVTFEAAGSWPDYAGKDLLLQSFIQQIQAGTIPADRQIPSSWILNPPVGNPPPDVLAAWNSYSLRKNSELPAARDNAGAFASAGTNANAGTNQGRGATCGFDRYGQPLPCGGQIQYPKSAILPGSPDLYGGEAPTNDIYTYTGGQQVNYPEGGTGIVANPFAPQSTSAPASPARKGHPRRTAGLALGSVLLLGVAVLAMKRKRSKSRRSR